MKKVNEFKWEGNVINNTSTKNIFLGCETRKVNREKNIKGNRKIRYVGVVFGLH